MRRLGLALALLVLGCSFALGVGASPARATVVTPPYADPIYRGDLIDALAGGGEIGTDGVMIENMYGQFDGGWFNKGVGPVVAEDGGLVWPATLAVGAGVFGWYLGGAINRWLNISTSFGTPSPSVGNVTSAYWAKTDCTASWGCGDPYSPLAPKGSRIYQLKMNVSSPDETSGSPATDWAAGSPPDCSGFIYSCNATTQLNIKTYAQNVGAGSARGSRYRNADGTAGRCDGFGSASPCMMTYTLGTGARIGSDAQISHLGPDVSQGGTTLPTSVSDDTYHNIVNAIREAPANVQTAINCTISPTQYSCPDSNGNGGGPIVSTPPTPTFTPFTLPAPLPTETYPQYVTRLRNLGWIGTVTVLSESALEATATTGSAYQLAPLEAPTAVTVGLATPVSVPVFNPDGSYQPWPDNPPVVQPQDVGITITVKPSDSSLPPGGGPPAGGGIDFGPISGIDWGCKFPFGFVCYAQAVVSWFNVTPQAPRFNLSTPCGHDPAHGIAPTSGCSTGAGGHLYLDQHYDVNLSVMDSYMAIWRGLVSVVLWIGAVYFCAVRFLGFNAGGDPGEAIDDAGMDSSAV